jgi:hypothetical protein
VAGKAAVKQFYSKIFEQSPKLYAQIVTRIVVGGFVIDEEHGSGLVFEGMPSQLHAAIVYYVVEGKSSKLNYSCRAASSATRWPEASGRGMRPRSPEGTEHF